MNIINWNNFMKLGMEGASIRRRASRPRKLTGVRISIWRTLFSEPDVFANELRMRK